MRTTVTLDANVEMLLCRAAQQSQKSFKEVLNDAVLRGLGAEWSGDSTDCEIQARPLKMRAGLDHARLHHIDDEIEIDEFRPEQDHDDAANGNI
jgi:hypothetical protein